MESDTSDTSDANDSKRSHASEARPGKRLYESDSRFDKTLCATEDEFGNYDVFMSHRGPDTKTGFVGYLYKALKSVGLHPFFNCKSTIKGQDAWTCIDHAIKTTPLGLVIFSKSFTQSEWCLKELHAMLESSSMKVLPIFYKVQPWEVSFPEKGQLADGFRKLTDKHDMFVMEEWRADLKRASKLNGWEHKVGDNRLEADLVMEVVDKIFALTKKPFPLAEGGHIGGLKQVAENLIQAITEKKVLLLGLWGMGGIGKSTLARELYNQLGQRFDARCYVEDVVEMVNQGGVMTVQNHILKALCENESIQNIIDKSSGKVILEERLSKKPFLLVLDDVRDDDEMDYLLSYKMLKEGSICIVTSRNRRIFEKLTSFLNNHDVHIHDVQLLSQEDSRSLFVCHAFGGDGKVPQRFEGLVGDVSMASGGVPLVLVVLGSLLRDEEDVEIWEEVLKKLNCGTILDERKIFECLRISYDSLLEQHQEIFLDIACALLGQSVEMAKLVWRSQGWSATLGVQTLVEKALIRVDEEGNFRMHDHLRDMGRTIAKLESASLGICKRLWGFESLALLKKNESLPNSLQTLILPWSLVIQVDLSIMKGLRIFKCEGGLFSTSSLPENLRWLDYIKNMHAPSIQFPEALENNELVILFWRDDSMDRLPESFGNLKKLQVLNLRACYTLVELPNSFEGLQNLKNLDLERSGIQSLPKSFGKLSNLVVLNLQACSRLVGLPDSFGDLQSLKNLDLERSGIQSFPESFGKLSNLEVLNMRACSRLVGLPNSFGGLQNLKILNLETSAIQSFPESFGKLSNLEVLNVRACSRLVGLPNSFGGLHNLKNLDLESSGIQSFPESFGKLSNLGVLNLRARSRIVALPDSLGGLHNLKNLDLERSGIQSFPESFGKLSNLEVLNLRACSRLVGLPDSFGGLNNLKNLDLERSGIQSFPESFGKLSNLEVLNLQACSRLVGLPNSFGGLNNLTYLDLERSGIQSFPESFGKLSKLEVLNLRACSRLVGLPASFEGLQNLKNLDLERSGIQSFPECFGKLSNLEVLNLRACSRLVGLPNSFRGLKNLKDLDFRFSAFQNLLKPFGMLSNLEVLNLKSCNAEVQDDFKGSSSVVLIEDDDYLSKDFKVSCQITKWVIYRDLLERTLLCFFNMEEMQYEFYFEDHESMATIIGLGVPYSKVVLKCGSLYVTVVEIPKEDWDVVWAHSKVISCSIPKGYVFKQERFLDILHCIANVINTDNIVSKANNGGGGRNNGEGKAHGNANDSKGKRKAYDHDNHRSTGHQNGGSNGAPDDNDNQNRKGKDENDEKRDGHDLDNGKTSYDCEEVQAVVHLRLLPGGDLQEKKKEGEVHEEEVEEKKNEGEGSKGVEKRKKKRRKGLWHTHKLGVNGNVVGNQQEWTITEEVRNGDVDENLEKQLEKQIHSYMVFTFTIKDEAGGQLKTIQATIDPITFQLPSNNEENYLQRRRFGWFHNKLQVAFGVVDTQVADLDAKSCKVLDSSKVKEVNLCGNSEGNAKSSTNAIKGELGIRHGVIASAGIGRTGGLGTHTTKEVQNTWETNKPLTKGGFSILEHSDLNAQQLKYSYHPHSLFKEKEFEIKDEDDRLKMYEDPICQLQRVSCEGTWHPDHSETLEAYRLEASRELGMTRIYNLETETRVEKMQKGVWKVEKSLPLYFIQKLEKVVYLNHAMSHLTSSTTGVYRLKERQDPSNSSTSILTQAQNKREPEWPCNDPLVDVKQRRNI